MNHERAAILDNYTKSLIHSFRAFDMLPDKYKTLSFNHFLILLASKRLQDKTGGYFVTLGLCHITGLGQSYLYKWLELAITRGFILVPVEKSFFELSPFGLLAVRQFRRLLWRLMNPG